MVLIALCSVSSSRDAACFVDGIIGAFPVVVNGFVGVVDIDMGDAGSVIEADSDDAYGEAENVGGVGDSVRSHI
ncbi:Hypothetical predicted protein [Octopus vulgaris]|uniref:Uncharacterized protein n=1 Tax=Octopus vulgaris TaxID=6645 RepID=A0AA36F0I9_OCTVU|nr:Hypothetical predicted protein [Octopus vulgaris]